MSADSPSYLPPVYVAIWPTGFDADGQHCLLRGVCRLCGWRGPIAKTRNHSAPEKTPEGLAVSKQAARHLASHNRVNGRA